MSHQGKFLRKTAHLILLERQPRGQEAQQRPKAQQLKKEKNSHCRMLHQQHHQAQPRKCPVRVARPKRQRDQGPARSQQRANRTSMNLSPEPKGVSSEKPRDTKDVPCLSAERMGRVAAVALVGRLLAAGTNSFIIPSGSPANPGGSTCCNRHVGLQI